MPAGDGWTLGTDPVTGKQVWLKPGEKQGDLGIGYGGPASGTLNPWDITGRDARNPGGIMRDDMTNEQRMAAKAQKGLYQQDEWSKGVEGRDPLSMRAAALGPYTPMGWADAGKGAFSTASMLDPSQMDESRKYQMALMGQLQTQAAGGGPSLAGAQLKSGMEQNLAAQMSAAASQRGTANTSMGQRNYAMLGAQQGQNLASQSAMARMQEQLNAQQQLGALSSNVRGQDYATANANAGYGQQMSLANMSSANQFALANAGFRQQAYGSDAQWANQYGLQQGMFNQQANQANLSAGLSQRSAGDAARMGAFDATQGAWQTAAGIGSTDRNAAAARKQAQDASDRDFWSKIIAAGGTAAVAASDENNKKDKKSGDGQLSAFFKSYAAAGGMGGGLDSLNAGLLGAVAAKKKGPGDASPAPDVVPLDISRTRNEIYGSPMGGSSSKWGLGTKPAASSSAWSPALSPEAMTRPPTDGYFTNDVAQPFPDLYGYHQYEPAAPIPWANNQGGAPGSMPVLSDRNEKTGVVEASGVGEFLSNLGSHSYRYKDPNAPGAGEGRFVSPMAQELEKTAIGRSAVLDTPQGKMVDYGKLSGAMLAGEAMHEKRISSLEEALGLGKKPKRKAA